VFDCNFLFKKKPTGATVWVDSRNPLSLRALEAMRWMKAKMNMSSSSYCRACPGMLA